MQEEMSQLEPEEDDEEKEFPPLTREKKQDAKKFESQLSILRIKFLFKYGFREHEK